jgi:ribosome-binding factor A
MGRLIALKFTPELRFLEDESFAEAEKIETLLRSSRVARDLSTPKAADMPDEDDVD